MAISRSFQRALYAKQASESKFFKNRIDADAYAAECRESGKYSRVEVRPWNNGTSERRIIEYKVNLWAK